LSIADGTLLLYREVTTLSHTPNHSIVIGVLFQSEIVILNVYVHLLILRAYVHFLWRYVSAD